MDSVRPLHESNVRRAILSPHLQRLQSAIAAATGGLSEAEMVWHPEGKWSSAEILEHLSLTYTSTTKVFERCLREGTTSNSRTFRNLLNAFVVTRLGYLPEGRKAPPFTVPKDAPVNEISKYAQQALVTMSELIDACESRYGRRICIADHPVLGPLPADQWRKFHWIHGHHHLKQIFRLQATFKNAQALAV